MQLHYQELSAHRQPSALLLRSSLLFLLPLCRFPRQQPVPALLLMQFLHFQEPLLYSAGLQVHSGNLHLPVLISPLLLHIPGSMLHGLPRLYHILPVLHLLRSGHHQLFSVRLPEAGLHYSAFPSALQFFLHLQLHPHLLYPVLSELHSLRIFLLPGLFLLNPDQLLSE